MLLSVHYLRGIAALCVLLLHVFLMGGHSGWFPELGFGVHLFFVISGFVIYTSTQSKFEIGEYLWRRFVRVYPIYWVAIAFGLIVGMRTPLMADLFLLPGEVGPVYWEPRTIGVAWTLIYEVMFYLIFGLAMALGRWWLAVIAIILLVALQPLLGPLAPYGEPIILEFAMGVLLARFANKLSPWMLLPALALLFMDSGEIGSLYRALKMGGCAALLVGGFVALERRLAMPNSRPLSLLGDASYSLYIFHVPVIFMLGSPPWYVTILPCLIVGISAHLYVEKPILQWLKNRPKPVFQTSS